MKPAATKRYAEYEAILTEALVKPITTPPALPEKLVLGPVKGKKVNAAVIERVWVFEKDPEKRGENQVISDIGSTFFDVYAMTGTRVPTSRESADGVRERFDEFLHYKYLVVVDGTASGGAVSAEKTGGTYAGGGYTGTITFVDLEKRAPIGVLHVDSGMSDQVNVVTGPEVKHSVDRQLAYDARTHGTEAVYKALEPYVASE